MSVLAVIQHEVEAEGLTRWARQFALARSDELVVLILHKGASPEGAAVDGSEPLARCISDMLIKEGVSDPPRMIAACPKEGTACVLKQVQKHGASLLVVGKQQRVKGVAGENALARQLFDRAPCDTILMRLTEKAGRSCDEILVPASGGRHSLRALKLANQVIERNGGELTPLFVEADADDAAKEVGERVLYRLLDKAGVDEGAHIHPRAVAADDVFKGIGQVIVEGFDLMIIGASDKGPIRRILFGTVPDRFLKGEEPTAVAVFRSAKPMMQRIQEKVERWLDLTIPQLSREERIALFENLERNSRWNFDFLALLSLSTAIAALGLIQSSTAVVIGAMLVAPLMVPLIGTGLALAQGNVPLIKIASKAVLFGFLTALGIGFVMGLVIPIPVITPELAARGSPTLLDLGVAFFSGFAAAYCVGRPNLSGALPGVAISAALVPPIATTGIALAMNETEVASGAALLFGTNVVTIILGAAISLYMGGARGKRGPGGASRWVKRTLLALVVIAVVEAIPLGSYLVAHWRSKRPGVSTVPNTYSERLKLLVATHYGSRLIAVKRNELAHHLRLDITIAGPVPADEELARKLADQARSQFGREVRVRVSSQMVVEGVAPRYPRKPVVKPPVAPP